MKRFHLHVSVENLDESIRFYSTLFAEQPAVRQSDYAKWMLEDPRMNFAISQRDGKPGVQHLGIQAEDRGECAATVGMAELIEMEISVPGICRATNNTGYSRLPIDVPFIACWSPRFRFVRN